MTRLSYIQIAVLGLLSGKSMSGPELKNTYRATNSKVWPSEPHGLYPVAASLVKAGYLIDRGDRHPKRWSITDAGVDALCEAVSTADPKPAVRHPIFVVCAYFEYAKDWDTIEAIIKSHMAGWEELLKEEEKLLNDIVSVRSPLLRTRLERSTDSVSAQMTQAGKMLALEGQVGIAKSMIDWAQGALRVITRLRVTGHLTRPPLPDADESPEQQAGPRSWPHNSVQLEQIRRPV
jgi:DNA-binding PadR family transcriptional regulator